MFPEQGGIETVRQIQVVCPPQTVQGVDSRTQDSGSQTLHQVLGGDSGHQWGEVISGLMTSRLQGGRMGLGLKAGSGFKLPEAASYRLWGLGQMSYPSESQFYYLQNAGIKTPSY